MLVKVPMMQPKRPKRNINAFLISLNRHLEHT